MKLAYVKTLEQMQSGLLFNAIPELADVHSSSLHAIEEADAV